MRIPLHTRYADYDTKGHVNNAVYLTYFEMARERAWVDVLGGGVDFPFVVAEAIVRYRSQAMIGEPLDIEICTTEIRTKAWVWSYVIRDPRDERVVAEGSTVQVMFDYENRRTIPIPEEFRARLAEV
jgi:acyl-CoA thioester hydrolase